MIEFDDIGSDFSQNATTNIGIGDGNSPIGDVLMSAKANRNVNAIPEDVSTFDVQVCSNDGRLFTEYSLNPQDDNVKTLSAAEKCACESLSDYKGEPLVVVVSERSLTKLHQVQTDCQTGKTDID